MICPICKKEFTKLDGTLNYICETCGISIICPSYAIIIDDTGFCTIIKLKKELFDE
jgi:ribosomal protein L37AE/L43A